ncbi:MAG: hypothetical protein JNN15_00815 [Blastocatellia bacterium]|nr:hypothetical protein [Blastocatellia bacterium]
MIFASDLDRTLIYSDEFTSAVDVESLLAVELLEGKEISFMTHVAFQLLKELSLKCLFIPITTRTIEQYKRIYALSEWIAPEYAIVSNGGNVLYKGEVDKQWQENIAACVSKIDSHFVVESKLTELFSSRPTVSKVVFRDGLFWSIHFHKLTDEDRAIVSYLEQWSRERGWQTNLQGRKLYVLPYAVDKWNALAYVKEKTGESHIVAAGDGELDFIFMKNAYKAFCVAHGEIARRIETLPRVHLTKEHGIKAGEELLREILLAM